MDMHWMDQQQYGFRYPKMPDLPPDYAHQIIRKWWFEHVWTMEVNEVPYFQANPLVRDGIIWGERLKALVDSSHGLLKTSVAPLLKSDWGSTCTLTCIFALFMFLRSCHQYPIFRILIHHDSSMFLHHALFISSNTSHNLVGGFNPPEKYESQIGSSSQLLWKIKFMFQTTNQQVIPSGNLT